MATNIGATATAGPSTPVISNNETLSPILENEATASSNDEIIGAIEELPEEIRFLHECTDENFSLGIRTFDKTRGPYETPSTSDRSITDYGHATADSEMRHQQLEQRKINLLAKLHEQKLRKEEEDIMIECDRLERQLEDESKVIDLVDNMQSTMTSVTSSTSASHTTSATKETPIAQQLALLDFGRLITLNGSITSEQATTFYNQSKQADFTLPWKQVIMAGSLDYIRLRVAKSYNQMKITKQEARLWNPDKLNCKQMAKLIN